MGIEGLWKLVDAAQKKNTLPRLAIKDGFEEGSRGDRVYTIGVDVSIWEHQLLNMPGARIRQAQRGENQELWAFFGRLGAISNIPVHLVFVADGDLRPSIKRGTRVDPTKRWLERLMENFARAFGFSWFEAVGEAEAELAVMNAMGRIDAVLTDDSDVLIFGAHTIIRNPANFKPGLTSQVSVYRADAIRQQVYITRGDMLLYALLVGSDYDNKRGLPGCGTTIAAQLVQRGFGRKLHHALLQHLTKTELTEFLEGWRADVRRVLITGASPLTRAQPGVAANLTDTFPDLDIAHLLLSPTVSNPQRYASITAPQPMDIARIAQLCETHFAIGSSTGIVRTFRDKLWSAEVTRMLLAEGLALINRPAKVLSSSSIRSCRWLTPRFSCAVSPSPPA
ncbi:PIN domain-like protein [Epithele typhae]|uniref:PIN domain-like protein n=1 Tax=Epithele typhae TaxID=378194 RepID=UPI0020086F0E|nr:PIN domain-like protein [Epithele typhae]KAH9928483.1 PIN domain-like protein [Epithele typhae]